MPDTEGRMRVQLQLRNVLLPEQLGNSLELDVAGPLVDCADLGVSPVLFQWQIPSKANTARPLDSRASHLASNRRGVPPDVSYALPALTWPWLLPG